MKVGNFSFKIQVIFVLNNLSNSVAWFPGVISDNLIVFDHNTLIVASAPGGQRNEPLPESPRARIMCGLAIAGNLIYLFGGASSIGANLFL